MRNVMKKMDNPAMGQFKCTMENAFPHSSTYCGILFIHTVHVLKKKKKLLQLFFVSVMIPNIFFLFFLQNQHQVQLPKIPPQMYFLSS